MTKEEWQQAYNEFDKLHSELIEHEQLSKQGSNQTLRSKAERKMEYLKPRIHFLFSKYPEVYILAVGAENNTDYGKAITIDEFFQNRYIVGDMGNLLTVIQEKIKSITSDN